MVFEETVGCIMGERAITFQEEESDYEGERGGRGGVREN